MTAHEAAVAAMSQASCPKEHTAHKNDGPPFRTWVTCGDAVLADRTWDVSSSRDLSDDCRWFYQRTLEEHRVQTWPAEAVRAIATSPGVRAALVAWPSGRCVNCGEDIYEHSYDDAVG